MGANLVDDVNLACPTDDNAFSDYSEEVINHEVIVYLLDVVLIQSDAMADSMSGDTIELLF
jgi:hypothetical protein